MDDLLRLNLRPWLGKACQHAALRKQPDPASPACPHLPVTSDFAGEGGAGDVFGAVGTSAVLWFCFIPNPSRDMMK